MTEYNYAKLLGRMRELQFTQAKLAAAIGVSETTLNLTLKNNRSFNQTEIRKVCEALRLSPEDIPEYFFS